MIGIHSTTLFLLLQQMAVENALARHAEALTDAVLEMVSLSQGHFGSKVMTVLIL
jgi:hypothetical protein